VTVTLQAKAMLAKVQRAAQQQRLGRFLVVSSKFRLDNAPIVMPIVDDDDSVTKGPSKEIKMTVA